MIDQPANPFQQSANSLQGANNVFQQLADGQGLTNINAYMNPFYDQVVSNTLSRMDRDKQASLNQIGDAAISAGAFGGARHGLMEGQFLGDYNQNVGNVTSQLQMQNFNQASSALRNDQLQGASGLMSSGNNYFNIGSTLQQQQQQAGDRQQQLLQTLLSGGAQEYSNMINSPNAMLNLFNALSANDPRRSSASVSQSTTPGLLDYLAVAADVGSAYLGNTG